MRSINQFTAYEWLKLVPFIHGFKQLRNDFKQNIFCKNLPSDYQDFIKNCLFLKGRIIGVIVAFNEPWSLNWLLSMANKYIENTEWIVFDNSDKLELRNDIKRIAEKIMFFIFHCRKIQRNIHADLMEFL